MPDIDTDTASKVALGASLLLILWMFTMMYSTKVYRFHRPGCGFCKSSQAEWDRFKRSCRFRMIRPIDVNMDNASAAEHKLAENFMVKGVPNVTAVYDSGLRITHSGSRTADAYHKWIESKGGIQV